MSEALRPDGDSWTLQFERRLAHPPAKVWHALTEPSHLSKWYPLTATEIEPRVGGILRFHDSDGHAVLAEIIEFSPPQVFAFQEFDETTGTHGLRFELEPDGDGSRLVFTHTFTDRDWAAHTAAGWHRCLDALGLVIDEREVVLSDNAAELRRRYAEALGLQ